MATMFRNVTKWHISTSNAILLYICDWGRYRVSFKVRACAESLQNP